MRPSSPPSSPSTSASSADPFVAIEMPPDSTPPPAPPGLSTGQQVVAWAADSLQQGVVSGGAWGCGQKALPMIGSVVGMSLGGPVGAGIGSFAGSIASGFVLGPVHLGLEVACTKARLAIGGAVAQRPDTNAAKSGTFKKVAFVGAFMTGAGVKSVVKDAAITGAGWQGAAIGMGADIVTSAICGALAQAAGNTRKAMMGTGPLQYAPVKNIDFQPREMVNRVVGGVAAGAVGGLLDFAMPYLAGAGSSNVAKLTTAATTAASVTADTTDQALGPMASSLAPAVASGGVNVGKAAAAAVKTNAMLSTWFMARDAISAVRPPAPPPPKPAEVKSSEGYGSLEEVVIHSPDQGDLARRESADTLADATLDDIPEEVVEHQLPSQPGTSTPMRRHDSDSGESFRDRESRV
jgi:hypothetical protein